MYCVNSLAGSAICVFSMASVNASFNGYFKHQPTPSSAWGPSSVANTNHFNCERSSHGDHEESLLANKYQLMDLAVQPLTVHPIYSLDFRRSVQIFCNFSLNGLIVCDLAKEWSKYIISLSRNDIIFCNISPGMFEHFMIVKSRIG
ncbi:Semaphorin-5A [Armadillidium vulgare]|nr:Semaphorin-5A [Armadillidium vulgare]